MTPIDQVLAPVRDARVLVIDDNAANILLARRVLTRAGLHDIVELQDPTLTRAVLRESSPDLVLLDLRMPVMDGFAVLDVIRRQAGATYLPVIVVTVDDSPESIQQALSFGANDFITKPYNAVELALRVRNLLLNRSAYEEMRRGRALLRTRLDLFEPDLAGLEENPDGIRALILDAIANGRMSVVLQPIVDMRDGSTVGHEALARFPAGRLSSPAAWFAAALEVGLVTELEVAALRRVLDLITDHPADTYVSLNVSPATVVQGLPDDLVASAPWGRIVIELTEHTPVEDYAALFQALERVRALGARIAVDDTGAGFASLKHILDLHPDIIKIDIGITRGVDRDPSRAAIAGMLARFGETTNVTVVAEGVETSAERDALLELGVLFGQGYLLGRPAPPK